MGGFFNLPKQTKQKGTTCVACGLYKNVCSPRMKPFGNFKKQVLCVGEAPGETEDLNNKQWQGKMGRVLQRAFSSLGFDLFEDCLNINSINCRPTNASGNRTPTSREILCCRSNVIKVIKEMHPKVVILFGECALESVVGARWRNELEKITRWRGWTIPDREYNAWICPTFDPGFVKRDDKKERGIETIWMQDLKRALSMVDVQFPKFTDESHQVEIITDLSVLDNIKSPFAFDYETTGLKPHDQQKHSIKCMSVCDSDDHAYAFMWPKDSENLHHIIKLLRSHKKKIASNMKFEHTWTYNVLGFEIVDWLWDTMLGAHVLDNRPKISSIKFLGYVHFGLSGYNDEVEQYLKTDKKKGANAVNRIDELLKNPTDTRKLLTYCGIDSLLEFREAMLQRQVLVAEEIGTKLKSR